MGKLAHQQLDKDVETVLGQPPDGDWSPSPNKVMRPKCSSTNSGCRHDRSGVTRGHGGFTGLLLGSVGVHFATHDSAPVVVIVRR